MDRNIPIKIRCGPIAVGAGQLVEIDGNDVTRNVAKVTVVMGPHDLTRVTVEFLKVDLDYAGEVAPVGFMDPEAETRGD